MFGLETNLQRDRDHKKMLSKPSSLINTLSDNCKKISISLMEDEVTLRN